MIEQVILTLVLLEVSVVVAVFQPLFAGIPEIVVLVYPAVGVERSLCGEVGHAALRRREYSLHVPVLIVSAPVIVVGVDVGAVDVIQLACLEVIGGGDLHDLAVKAQHVAAQTDYARAVSPTAEGEPADAVFVNAHARVERRLTAVESLGVAVNEGFPQGIGPGSGR